MHVLNRWRTLLISITCICTHGYGVQTSVGTDTDANIDHLTDDILSYFRLRYRKRHVGDIDFHHQFEDGRNMNINAWLKMDADDKRSRHMFVITNEGAGRYVDDNDETVRTKETHSILSDYIYNQGLEDTLFDKILIPQKNVDVVNKRQDQFVIPKDDEMKINAIASYVDNGGVTGAPLNEIARDNFNMEQFPIWRQNMNENKFDNNFMTKGIQTNLRLKDIISPNKIAFHHLPELHKRNYSITPPSRVWRRLIHLNKRYSIPSITENNKQKGNLDQLINDYNMLTDHGEKRNAMITPPAREWCRIFGRRVCLRSYQR